MHYQPILKDIRYMASLQGDFDWPAGEITVYPVIEGDATFVDANGKEYTSAELDKNGATIELGGSVARFRSKTLILRKK